MQGVRDWAGLNPQVALEVSEFLEVLAVARQSDLVGLVPKSLATAAKPIFDVQVVPMSGTPIAFDVCMT